MPPCFTRDLCHYKVAKKKIHGGGLVILYAVVYSLLRGNMSNTPLGRLLNAGKNGKRKCEKMTASRIPLISETRICSALASAQSCPKMEHNSGGTGQWSFFRMDFQREKKRLGKVGLCIGHDIIPRHIGEILVFPLTLQHDVTWSNCRSLVQARRTGVLQRKRATSKVFYQMAGQRSGEPPSFTESGASYGVQPSQAETIWLTRPQLLRALPQLSPLPRTLARAKGVDGR